LQVSKKVLAFSCILVYNIKEINPKIKIFREDTSNAAQ
jgi:hypothetical protein